MFVPTGVAHKAVLLLSSAWPWATVVEALPVPQSIRILRGTLQRAAAHPDGHSLGWCGRTLWSWGWIFTELLCRRQELNWRSLLSLSPAVLMFVEKLTSVGCWFHYFLAWFMATLFQDDVCKLSVKHIFCTVIATKKDRNLMVIWLWWPYIAVEYYTWSSVNLLLAQ